MDESQIPSTAPKKGERVIALDVVKGISISLVILAHVALFNFVPDEKWIMYIVYLFLDVFGPSMFVFLSSVGSVFGIAKRKGRIYQKQTRNAVFQRAFIIFLLGCIPNIAFNFKFGILSFWYWWILQFIAVSQIITYYALKIPKITRIILALLIIFVINKNLFNFLDDGMRAAGIIFTDLSPEQLSNPYAFIFWLIYYPAESQSFLPWVALPLIGSIIGENLVETIEDGTLKSKQNFFRSLMWNGILLIIISIGYGSQMSNMDYGFGMIAGLSGAPLFITELPEFLIMRSEMNILYDLGMGITVLGLVYYIVEIRGVRGRLTSFFNFYGRFSLSLFFFHILVGTWFLGRLNVWGITIYIFFVWGFLYYFLKMLVVRFQGKGTLEWITTKLTRAKNASKQFYEQQIWPFVNQFRNVPQKIKHFFVKNEYSVENPVEAFIHDALPENSPDSTPSRDTQLDDEKEKKE